MFIYINKTVAIANKLLLIISDYFNRLSHFYAGKYDNDKQIFVIVFIKRKIFNDYFT